jgi:hypothetical protein
MDWITPGIVAKCDLLDASKEKTGKTVLVRILEIMRADNGDVERVLVRTMNSSHRTATVDPRYLHAFPIPTAPAPKPVRPTKTTRRERKARKG